MGGLRVDRYEALLDFLLQAASVEETAPFPAPVLDALRQVVRCDAISYREWNPQELLESSISADEPEAWTRVWAGVYEQVREDDPLPGGPGPSVPVREWLGRPLAISDFISDREFKRGGLYAAICKPLGVRAVMKLFLPGDGATGAGLVFDTTSSQFSEADRLTLERLLPHLIQLRRNARARKSYAALSESIAEAQTRLDRLTAREQIVLARAAEGDTNRIIAQALYISPETVRKHLEHIYDKLEARNRTEAAAIYTRGRIAADDRASSTR